MATTTIKNGAGADVTVELPLPPGRAAASASRPFALSTEDKAVLDGITTIAGAVTSNRAAVNPISGQAGIAAGTGASGATTTRTVLASDSPEIALLGGVTEEAPASDTASSGINGRLQRIAQRLTSLITLWNAGAGTAAAALRTTLASDDPAVVALTATGTRPSGVQITRPANATPYTAGDAWADSGPTTGGFTLANAVRASGKASRLVGLSITSSNGAPSTGALQGEVLIYNAAVTAVVDNVALTITAAEARTELWEVPFALTAKRGVQIAHVPVGAPIMLPASGTDLRFLVRVTNGYTPVAGEVLTVSATFEPIG